jgi:UDP-glucose:(heptosyl)LPS alpha-1,3-glucosyltransferase
MNLGIYLQHYFPYGGLQRDAVRLARRADDATLVVSTSENPPGDIDLLTLNTGGTANHKKLARFSSACQELDQFDKSIAFSRVPGSDFHFCGDPCFREKFSRTKPAVAALLPRYRFLLKNEHRLFGPDSSTHIFFLAESEIPPFQEHYNIPSNRYTVLPPWLDKPQITESEISPIHEELNLPRETPLLLFVASNYQLKGLDLALKALAQLSGDAANCHLVICGRDDEKPFQKLAHTLQVSSRTHFLGSRDDVLSIMAHSHMLIHPAHQETAGMVLTESLAHQLPTLCTSVCGYAPHTTDAGCLTLSAEPSVEEIVTKTENCLSRRDTIVSKIQQWGAHPDRYKTAELMLAKIARGH